MMARSSCLGESGISSCSRTSIALTLVCTIAHMTCGNSCSPAGTRSWIVLETFVDGCSHPEARSGHACTSDGNIMYIHGGQNEFSRRAVAGLLGASEVCTAELLSFDMATLTWKVVTPNYRQPPSGGFFGVSLPENYLHLLRSQRCVYTSCGYMPVHICACLCDMDI